MAAIRRRDRAGKWWVDFRYRGRRIRRPSPDGTRRGAEALERKIRGEFAEDDDAGRDPFAGPSPKFAEFAERWMREYVVPRNKPSVHIEKGGYLKAHLLPAFGQLRLDQITAAAVDRFVATRTGRLKAKSINNILLALRTCLKTARTWGVLRHVPTIELLEVDEFRYRYLSEHEASLLLAAIRPGFWRAFIMFCLDTGCRFGEVAALRWEDLTLAGDAPCVVVSRATARGFVTSTKTRRIRTIPLTRRLVTELQSLGPGKGYVFAAGDGSLLRPEPTKHILHRLCRRAGIQLVSWHPLRHTFATHMVARGAPLRVVQKLLGHSTIEMTCRYAHASPELCHDWIDRLREPPSAEHGTLMVTTPRSPARAAPNGARKFAEHSKEPSLVLGSRMVDAAGFEPDADP